MKYSIAYMDFIPETRANRAEDVDNNINGDYAIPIGGIGGGI